MYGSKCADVLERAAKSSSCKHTQNAVVKLSVGFRPNTVSTHKTKVGNSYAAWLALRLPAASSVA
jgi:hypothetical protein